MAPHAEGLDSLSQRGDLLQALLELLAVVKETLRIAERQDEAFRRHVVEWETMRQDWEKILENMPTIAGLVGNQEIVEREQDFEKRARAQLKEGR